MRIQSITEVNTQQQQNPYSMQNADSVTAGKSASIVSFAECLRSHIQNVEAPAVTRKAEWMAIGSIWSYYRPAGILSRTQLKLKERSYAPLSNM